MEEQWKSSVVRVKSELKYKRKLVVRVHVRWKVRGGYTAGAHAPGACVREDSTSEGSDSSERLKTASVNFGP
jgi:hypothetical protein